MKMFMPLKVEESGIISWNVIEGAALSPGDMLGTLELDNPENVSDVTVFEGDLVVTGWGVLGQSSTRERPHLMLRAAIEKLNEAMAGYSLSKEEIDDAMSNLGIAVMEPTLPVFEIEEQLSVLTGRIPAKLFEGIAQVLNDFKTTCEKHSGSGVQHR
jgi:acetyl-CoA carboxylase/biotin carboxylase 1